MIMLPAIPMTLVERELLTEVRALRAEVRDLAHRISPAADQLRTREVVAMGLNRRALYRHAAAGRLTRVRVGSRGVRWYRHEVERVLRGTPELH